jgi:hypothetical protein
MKLLAWLMEAFINTFGITRPRPEQQRTAQLLIGGFVLTVVLGAIAVVVFFLFAIRAGH